MALDKSLVSGSTSMLVLRLLSDKDMYGYEIIDTLDQRSQNVFQLKAGTLYPLLHTLENQKLLTSYEKPANGRTRKYYAITKEGRKHLTLKQNEWQEYTSAVAHVLSLEV
ncbi:PadR family transcriptional regulator [Hespellia stercorisuis]|uniref:DNA-binding transcriptional regulator, PadR family n=1 Tax=Hespellia stercorisuis DSM 15480 TaxID=1121950 RepID=A0A1M6N0U5_9FIRM|nr:helix-turn-helix transcriptional regulator [Hespellia stercorisuis]SHJ89341.1 DNA-binding transcriptional regulator, PadR family [Hespellia stercorisuis DSM 15480]